MKKALIVFISFCAGLSLACAKEKKSKKTNKTVDDIEQTAVSAVDDIDIESIDVEIITREQIESMFLLAVQLNIDLKSAIENKDPSMAEELDYLIAEQKQHLDKLIPELKQSTEWTSEDENRLKPISAEYKKLSRRYKPSK